jgi:DNA gyrase subunit A
MKSVSGEQARPARAHCRTGQREAIEGISDIRDESDKSGMRVVIELKRGEVPEVVLNNLYKQTQLQDTLWHEHGGPDRRPAAHLNLKQMLEAFSTTAERWLPVVRSLSLRKARDRGHVLEGLAVAVSNMDEMIAMIKASPTPTEAKQGLMGRAWGAALVRELLARATETTIAEAFRPRGFRQTMA